MERTIYNSGQVPAESLVARTSGPRRPDGAGALTLTKIAWRPLPRCTA